MGIHRQFGYSATVEGFFVCGGREHRVAKSNGSSFVLIEPCRLAPGTCGDLVVIVDGHRNSRQVSLPDGALAGRATVAYQVVAPF
ncbi:MAG: hypothetical protein K2Y37_12795 [Pirellulales bacterium]|nr:hypothetical protein [Pirellulales bacterium]